VQVFTTSPLEDPRDVRAVYPRLEEIGYDGVFSFEAKHDPFVALAVAAEHTTRVQLGTAIAIAFARNPMTLAYLGNDLQLVTGGRFLLGLGSQIRPHVVNRFSSVWSEPARRMREMIVALDAIWSSWEAGTPLSFEGDFYRHTLMIPAFDPGPNPFGRPPVYVGGFGPRMVEVAGEVADGLIAHPFTSRESLETITLPALERGLAASGRSRADVQVVCATLVVTSDRDDELERLKGIVRRQLAFYGSTPAYAPTLECHGWGALHPELNALSKQGRWDDMAELIDDDVLETIAVVGPTASIAPALHARLDGIADAVSLTNNRAPDPDHWAGIVAELHAGA
jgi:probable F420-dependent oxidoreductase